jgi:hypothetical protein
MKPHRLVSVKPPDPKVQTQDPEQQLAEKKRIVRKVTGTRSDNAASRLIFQIQQAHVWPRVNEDAALQAALFAIAEIRPQSAIEGMLSAQMIAVHDMSLLLMARAIEEQYPEAIERNLILSNRCMRVFLEQVEALQRLQGKTGQQKVVVEHVQVNEGGRAVIGTVSAGTGGGGGE